MGEVFLAIDTILKRKVAIKFLKPETEEHPEIRSRFLLEAMSAASIDHPFVCKVYETGQAEGKDFIVFEFVEGQTLEERLKSGVMPLHEGLTIASQIIEGIAEAHERQIVHGDIKPSNIMIARTGHVKIMDFGLASHASNEIDDETTGSRTSLDGLDGIIGTPAYLSPEQLQGKKANLQSDVFSLGLVLYQIFCGAHPFQRSTLQTTIIAILSDEKSPGLTDANAPAALLEILNRMIQKDPAKRYPSAREVREEFTQLRRSLEHSAKPSQSAIAILPFADLSAEGDQDYFCDGLAEELINALSNVNGLRVVSRTASFRFRGSDWDLCEIGRRLNVKVILEGSVRRAAGRIRITVSLVSVEDGYPVWSERYDRNFEDIFQIQDEIAQSVVEKLRIARPNLAESPTVSFPAYELYLRGRYHWNRRTEESLKQSVSAFQMALREEPNYALALAGLADSYVTLALYGALPPMEVMPLAKASAEKALRLNAELPEALNSLACISSVYDWDWAAAERNFKKATDVNPQYSASHHWFAIHCLAPQGRFSEAHAAIQRARELDPTSLVIAATLGVVSYFERHYDRAISEQRKVLELDPNFGIAHYFLGQALSEQGNYIEAIAELERAVGLTGRSSECLAALACAEAAAGSRTKAIEFASELKNRSARQYVSPVLLAAIGAALHDDVETFDRLEEAQRQRASDLIWLRVRPVFDRIRSDVRFDILCHGLGL